MTTRAPRNTPDAPETPENTSQPVSAGLPATWGTENIEEFSGHDLTEKADLEGEPFLITGAEIERNEGRQYDNVYVYALDAKGVQFEFKDTSRTGVAGQVQSILADQGLNPAPGGGVQNLNPRIAVMKGLRVFKFRVRDEESGKMKDVETYYLSGRRLPDAPA